jgi:hypothetical protein
MLTSAQTAIKNTTMEQIDLREYVQRSGQWEWVQDEIRRLGEAEFYAMRDAMWMALHNLPEEMYFDIEKRVKAENRPLFVKIACEFMVTGDHSAYRFNRLLNKVHRDKYENKLRPAVVKV